MSLEVLRPGALTTIQDRGRVGFAHLGVPGAGAADPLSLRLANRLVGNREGAAALEITLLGPTLQATTDTVIAVTGGSVAVHVDDEPVATGQTVAVAAGRTISVRAVRRGLRAYLAVAGGVRVTPILGSRSTDTLSGLGPEPLQAGQRLPILPCTESVGRYLRRLPAPDENEPLRVIPGPHAGWFTPHALELLLEQPYQVDSASDRTGVRLKGPPLERTRQRELDSEGMVTGALQVPVDGQPIALLPNHGPTGGYPAIATVIAADLWRLGQARPAQALRFRAVSLAAAHAALMAQEAYLRAAVTTADAGLLAVRELAQLSGHGSGLHVIDIRRHGQRLRLRR